MNNSIKSTFPKRMMSKEEIIEYLSNHNKLIILSTYAKCSVFDLEMGYGIRIQKIYTPDGLNEYGGSFNEYLIIMKEFN